MAARKGTKEQRGRRENGQRVLFPTEWQGFHVAGVTNSELFASYYLQTRLKQEPEWEEPVVDARQRLKKLYDDCRDQVENWTEPQLRERLLQNVLSVLGFVLQPEVRIPDCPTKENVDWVFFAGETEREAAEARRGSLDYFADALALCEVKRWKVERFDRRGKRSDDRYVPARQIDEYLRFAEQVNWGILTNGRLWRLVHRDTSKKQRIYYQVDLPLLLQSKDDDAFRYFWLFFRREAFGPDGLLARALDSSRDYATKVGEDLENQVRPALEALCQGFFECRDNGLDPANQQHRIDARKEGLIFLYRLLFILYAEHRDLLPQGERLYQRKGLVALKQTAARMVDGAAKIKAIPPDNYSVWKKLRSLFEWIDSGRKNLGIFAYNGGLFRPDDHPFLAEKKVANPRLYKAIDCLARTQLPGSVERGFVDFRDLQVQHLGTLYEKLLTFRLREAKTGELVVLKTEGEERAKGARPRKRAGERKRTGSYYTPDYIVNYIVEQTVAPLLKEAAKRSEKNGTPFEDQALKLKVLDPAMGSGHFLVRATERIAEEIATNPRTEDVAPEGEEAVRFWARRVVERCIYGVDLNDMAVELAKLVLWLATAAKEKPLTFLDHHLKCGNSLVGAEMEDLGDPPFVEKTGRDGKKKLVPRRARRDAPGQLPLAFMTQFRDQMRDALHGAAGIINLPSDSREDIKKKEKLQKKIDELLARYRALADLWTSQHFGNKVTGAEYGEALDNTSPTVCAKSKWEKFGQRAFLRAAENERKNEKRRFFHWELEFPEVFFQPRKATGNGKRTAPRADIRKDNPGFDAVIGNPPWVSAWVMTALDHDEREAIARLSPIPGILKAHWDVSVAFLVRGITLCAPTRRLSFIVPNALCRDRYATPLRKMLLERAVLRSMLSFGEDNVFDQVARQTVVLVIERSDPPADHRIAVVDPRSTLRGGKEGTAAVSQASLLGLPGYQWRLDASPQVLGLCRKIREASFVLGNLCYVNYGAQVSSKAKGGSGKSSRISLERKRNGKRFFEGKDLSRYHIRWRGLYLDYAPSKMYGPRAPVLFEAPKLVFRHISGEGDSLIVALDEDGLYCDHGLVLATFYKNIEGAGLREEFDGVPRVDAGEYDIEFLAAVAASRLASFYYKHTFATGSLQGSFSHVYPRHVRSLPIPKIEFSTRARDRSAERKKMVEGLRNLYANELHDNLVARVAELLPRDAAGNFLAFPPGATGKEEHSDAVHDILAFLAEEMTRFHAERAKKRDDFFAWLRDVRYVDVTRFKTGRKRLATLWKLTSEAFFDLLGKNRLRPDGDEYSAIRGGLEKVLEKLSALQAKIESTDRLIDRIVYTLYGLTDEEVQIIEGGT